MAIDWGKVNKQASGLKDELEKFDTRTTKKYASGVAFPQTAAGGGKTSTGSSSPAPLKTGSSAQNVGRELAFARRTRADSGTIKKLQDQQNAYLAQQPKDTGADFLKDFGWGLGYGSERVAGGLLGALEGLSDFVGSSGSKALEYITSFGYSHPNDVSEFWRKQAENYLSTSPTETYKQSIEERYNPKDWQRTVGDLNETVSAMLPSLAASYATGGGSAVAQLGSTGSKLLPTGSNLGRALMGVQAAGGGAQQAFQEGADIGEALTFGSASGALESATEALVGGVPGLGKGAASELLEKVISNPLVRRSIDVAGEGAEEAISTIVTPYLQRAIYDPDAKNASLDEIAQSAVMGMAAAGVLQAGFTLPTSFSTRADVTQQANANLNDPEFVRRTTNEAIERINQNLNRQPFTLPTVEAQTASMPQVDTTAQVQQETAAPRRQGVQMPIQERTWQDAGNRKVNAFQYDHPELRPYYAEAARALKYDLASAVKGERMPIYDASSGTRDIIGYTGTKRSVTEPIAQALDNAKLSYAQIDKAIDDLITDHGQENYAAAKKLELVLDDMLTNGYTDSDGYEVPPNEAYLAARDQANTGIEGNEFRMSEDEWNSLMAQEPEGPAMLPTFEPEYGPESSVGAARKGFDPYSAFLGTKSEFFSEGANAARPVDVPTTDADGRRVSKRSATIMGAKGVTDETASMVADYVMSGRMSYDRRSNSELINTVERQIVNDGFERSLERYSDAINKGIISDEIVVLGDELLVNASNAGDINAVAEILSLAPQISTKIGRAQQAMSILRKLSPTAQLYAAQKAVDNLNKTIGKKKGSSTNAEENVPVEIWMQRVGENLADELSRRVNAPKEKAKSVSETILSDLRKFANESAPKKLQTGKKRSNIDRIVDLFQNKDAYNEAWQAAKDTLSDNFDNNPEALSAFEEWLDSSLDYSKMLTKELTGQTEIAIPQNLVEEFLQQTDQEGRDAVMKKIYKSVGRQVPSTWKDKWNAWKYLAMLGNPRTHIRNTGGNVFFQPVRIMKDRLAAAIEAGVSAASGGKLQRSKSFVYNPALYAAAWNDYNNVADILSGNKYDDVQSIINDNRIIFNKGFPTKALELLTGKTFDYGIMEGLRRGNTGLLGAEDAVAKRFTYADTLAGYLAANGVTAEQLKSGSVDPALMSAARDYAGQEALKATYNDRNVVSDRVVQIARPLGMFGEAILPFKRTPANILVRGFEYSPLGLAKGLTRDLYKVKIGEMTGAQAIDNIAAGLTGSGLMLLGGLLAAAGTVSGGAGDDDKQAGFDQLTGAQTYALNLPGGGSVTLDWLAPEALPFFMGVQAMDSFGEEGLTPDTILGAFSSISEPMLEMSMLQSLNDLIDNVSFAASNEKLQGLVWSSLVSYFTQALPTLGGQIERSYEDIRMSTYTDKNSLIPADAQYALGKASAKIPVWDFQQIPYIDEWGRTESNGPLALRTFNNFLNPAYTSQRNVTPLDEEIQRIYDETGEGGVIPNRAPKYLTIDGERIDLDAEQYVQYATERGQLSYEIGSDMIGKRAFSGLTDEQKAEVLSEVYSYADSIAKMSISSYTPPKWIQKVVSSGVDPATAILYHESDADTETKRRMLMNDNTLTAAEKSAIDKALFDDGMYIPKEMDVDYSSEETFTITQLSDAGQRKWEAAQRWGMPYEDYAKYYPICSSSGKGMTKDVVINNLIKAGMSRSDAYTFWKIVRN